MNKKSADIIEKLNQIVWHDIPIEKIELSTDKIVKFTVKALLFNEIEQKYDKIKLEFIDILSLKTNGIELSDKSNLEIFKFDYIQKTNWECNLILLSDVSEPSVVINLICKTVNFTQNKS